MIGRIFEILSNSFEIQISIGIFELQTKNAF